MKVLCGLAVGANAITLHGPDAKAEPATLGGAKIPANPGLTEADAASEQILCRDPMAEDPSKPAEWCTKWLTCVTSNGCAGGADSDSDTCWQGVQQAWGPGSCESQCAFWGDKEEKPQGAWTKRIEGFLYSGGNVEPNGMALLMSRDEAKELCLMTPVCGGITTDGEKWWLKTIEHVMEDFHHQNPLPGAEQHWHSYILADRVNKPDVFQPQPEEKQVGGDFLAGRGKGKCMQMCQDSQETLARCVSRVAFYKGELMGEKATNPVVYADFSGSCLEQLWSMRQATDPTHKAVSGFSDGSGCPFH